MMETFQGPILAPELYDYLQIGCFSKLIAQKLVLRNRFSDLFSLFWAHLCNCSVMSKTAHNKAYLDIGPHVLGHLSMSYMYNVHMVGLV